MVMILTNENVQNHFPTKAPGVLCPDMVKNAKNQNFSKLIGIMMESAQMIFRSCHNIIPGYLLSFYRFMGHY